jgi:hypothetical protein
VKSSNLPVDACTFSTSLLLTVPKTPYRQSSKRQPELAVSSCCCALAATSCCLAATNKSSLQGLRIRISCSSSRDGGAETIVIMNHNRQQDTYRRSQGNEFTIWSIEEIVAQHTIRYITFVFALWHHGPSQSDRQQHVKFFLPTFLQKKNYAPLFRNFFVWGHGIMAHAVLCSHHYDRCRT